MTLCTGFKEKSHTEAKLTELVRDVERVKVGIVGPQESQIADHRHQPLTQHIEAYIAHLEAAGRPNVHRKDTRRQLLHLEAECGFKTFGEMTAETLEKWLVARVAEGMAARTRNSYLVAGATVVLQLGKTSEDGPVGRESL